MKRMKRIESDRNLTCPCCKNQTIDMYPNHKFRCAKCKTWMSDYWKYLNRYRLKRI